MPDFPDRPRSDDPVTEEDLEKDNETFNVPEEDTPLETEGDTDLPPPAGSGVS